MFRILAGHVRRAVLSRSTLRTTGSGAQLAKRYAFLPISHSPSAVAPMTMIKSLCRSIHPSNRRRTSALRAGRNTT